MRTFIVKLLLIPIDKLISWLFLIFIFLVIPSCNRRTSPTDTAPPATTSSKVDTWGSAIILSKVIEASQGGINLYNEYKNQEARMGSDQIIIIPKGNYYIGKSQSLILRNGYKLIFEGGCNVWVTDTANENFSRQELIKIAANNQSESIISCVIEGNGLNLFGKMSFSEYNMDYAISINSNRYDALVKNITIRDINIYNFAFGGIIVAGNSFAEQSSSLNEKATIHTRTDGTKYAKFHNPALIYSHYFNTDKLIRIGNGYYRIAFTSLSELEDSTIINIVSTVYWNSTDQNIDTMGVFVTGIPEDIMFENVKCYRNGGNGFAIIQANNITLKNCTSSYTFQNNYMPGIGVDLEPNVGNQVFGCVISGGNYMYNQNDGIKIHKGGGVAASIKLIKNINASFNSSVGITASAQREEAVYLSDVTCSGNMNSGIFLEGNHFVLSGILSKSNYDFGIRIAPNANETPHRGVRFLISDSRVISNKNNIYAESNTGLGSATISFITVKDALETNLTLINFDEGNISIMGLDNIDTQVNPVIIHNYILH